MQGKRNDVKHAGEQIEVEKMRDMGYHINENTDEEAKGYAGQSWIQREQ